MLRAIDHFENTNKSDAIHSDQERRKWFIAAKAYEQRQEEISEKAEDGFIELAVTVIVATEAERQIFKAKLDKYDTATTQALMINAEALELVQLELDAMLEHAHTLEDGRKVFKSEDGTWAVDENGVRLDSNRYNVEELPQTSVSADSFVDKLTTRDNLINERDKLHNFQDKLDDARERSNSDNFSKEELNGLENELDAEMPMAVKPQLPDYDPSTMPRLNGEFTSSAKKPAIEGQTPNTSPIIMPDMP